MPYKSELRVYSYLIIKQAQQSTYTQDFVGPSVSLQAVSRPIALSLQSALQLSLTVLVCYRSHSDI